MGATPWRFKSSSRHHIISLTQTIKNSKDAVFTVFLLANSNKLPQLRIGKLVSSPIFSNSTTVAPLYAANASVLELFFVLLNTQALDCRFLLCCLEQPKILHGHEQFHASHGFLALTHVSPCSAGQIKEKYLDQLLFQQPDYLTITARFCVLQWRDVVSVSQCFIGPRSKQQFYNFLMINTSVSEHYGL